MALTQVQSGMMDSVAQYYSFKNRIINGQMQIAQRATSATITAGSTIAAGYSTVDRFYVYCTGANVTAAQVSGSGSTKNRLQITGAASVTAIGVGQRIEQLNSYDLANSTATLSVDLANSLLTSVTWTAYYANTADTFGTLASPTRTQISTGTFTVTSTVTNYNAQIAIPAAATTGIEIVFTVGSQTSGTFTIGNVQLEKGSTATSFDYRDYQAELAKCQRYYEKSYPQGTAVPTNLTNAGYAAGYSTVACANLSSYMMVKFAVTKRALATIQTYSYASSTASTASNGSGTDLAAGSASVSISSDSCFQVYNNAGSSITPASGAFIVHWSASAEL
jgi:hypothetical protein